MSSPSYIQFIFNRMFNWSESSIQFSPLFNKIIFSITNSIRTHIPRSLLFNWIVYSMWTSIWRNLLFSRIVYLIEISTQWILLFDWMFYVIEYPIQWKDFPLSRFLYSWIYHAVASRRRRPSCWSGSVHPLQARPESLTVDHSKSEHAEAPPRAQR